MSYPSFKNRKNSKFLILSGQTGAGKTFTIIGDTPNDQVFEEYVQYFQVFYKKKYKLSKMNNILILFFFPL